MDKMKEIAINLIKNETDSDMLDLVIKLLVVRKG